MADATTDQDSAATSSFSLTEIQGDLFSGPVGSALVHCVSRDFEMSKGIAVEFKKRFQGVNDLKAQNPAVGELAVLKRGNRFVYYMVTKERYFNKPTYATFESSLTRMRDHALAQGVLAICMPRIGCATAMAELPIYTTQHVSIPSIPPRDLLMNPSYFSMLEKKTTIIDFITGNALAANAFYDGLSRQLLREDILFFTSSAQLLLPPSVSTSPPHNDYTLPSESSLNSSLNNTTASWTSNSTQALLYSSMDVSDTSMAREASDDDAEDRDWAGEEEVYTFRPSIPTPEYPARIPAPEIAPGYFTTVPSAGQPSRHLWAPFPR